MSFLRDTQHCLNPVSSNERPPCFVSHSRCGGRWACNFSVYCLHRRNAYGVGQRVFLLSCSPIFYISSLKRFPRVDVGIVAVGLRFSTVTSLCYRQKGICQTGMHQANTSKVPLGRLPPFYVCNTSSSSRPLGQKSG